MEISIWGRRKTVHGTEGPKRAIVVDPSSNRSWARKNYLIPIPVEEINLNGSLLQNPGY
ncbi:RagB/SusD family nutrient uptake outer membrane protein [Thalassobellus suaedae]|uniref:RagB/SusD family nutrient uptake outer membrane protein n=1 Tax=Thalassobellus suaedae TaxID=3074124 RepID=UPI0039F5E7BE